MDYTVFGILQVKILEWVAFPFSRGSFQPRDQTQVSHIEDGFFTSWATREAQYCKILIVSIEINHILIEHSSQCILRRWKPEASHLATWRFCLLEKIPPKVFSSTSLEWPLSGTANQSLGHQTPTNRLMDSHDTPKESTESWLDLHIIWWFKSELFPGVEADNIC